MPTTLFAPITLVGRAATAAFRLSGPQAAETLEALTGRALPAPRRAVLRQLRDPGTGEPIDQALALWMPGPDSFTGEDVVELHLHGGRAVAAALMAVLARQPGLVAAAPGAFSRRAFDNGRLDLTEAEAIADLVDAETQAQRRQALRQLDGALGRQVADWASRLTAALAHLEASIDFADEELPADLEARTAEDLAALAAEIAAAIHEGTATMRLRDGLSVVILGPPNVGKSSLMNALAARDVAIVAERAGTTRDVVEVHLELDGWPVILADTAGLRDSPDSIEAEGVRRARARAEQADVILLVLDATAGPDLPAEIAPLAERADIIALNKCDLTEKPAAVPTRFVAVSALTGAGVAQLTGALRDVAATRFADGSGLITRERHGQALRETTEALARAQALAGSGAIELMAHEARAALTSLGRITGAVDTEALLDVVFRDFCIGK